MTRQRRLHVKGAPRKTWADIRAEHEDDPEYFVGLFSMGIRQGLNRRAAELKKHPRPSQEEFDARKAVSKAVRERRKAKTQ